MADRPCQDVTVARAQDRRGYVEATVSFRGLDDVVRLRPRLPANAEVESVHGFDRRGRRLVWDGHTSMPAVEFSRKYSVSARARKPTSEAARLSPLAPVAGTIAAPLAIFRAPDDVDTGRPPASTGDPSELDLPPPNATGVHAAPAERFAEMTEEEALAAADDALEDDDPEKAQAILDRYDSVQSSEAAGAESDAEAGDGAATDETAGAAADAETGANGGVAAGADAQQAAAGGGLGDRATRASQSFLDEFREEDVDEDDIGGYYHDIRFIADSLRSKSFRIVATFLLVLSGTFAWLYTGGIGDVRDDFLRRLPEQVVQDSSEIGVIALHPVEVLIFEIKLSALLAVLAVVPLIGYYAWPALRERGFVRGHRNVIFGWVAVLLVGLVGGLVLGYYYVAPAVISYLVADALAANMVISYRISDFFWPIFFTTAGNLLRMGIRTNFFNQSELIKFYQF
jgi:sec-independent protein translocase protein TatC